MGTTGSKHEDPQQLQLNKQGVTANVNQNYYGVQHAHPQQHQNHVTPPPRANNSDDLQRQAHAIVECSFREQFTKASDKQPVVPFVSIPQQQQQQQHLYPVNNISDHDGYEMIGNESPIQPPVAPAPAAPTEPIKPKANLHTAPLANASVAADGSMLIGNYKLMHLLGQGSFGKVYQVRADRIEHQWQKKDLAMKMISIHDHRLIPLIHQEIENTRHAESQFVIEIYDILRYEPNGESHVCIIMELCSFTLGQLLRSRTLMAHLFPESLIIYLLVTIMEGLQKAHEQRIIHRDIKPDNILLTQDLKIKIADFGISKKLDMGNDMTMSYIGTVPYMAPEQLSNQAYDTKVDVFALGTTLFEVLTCRIITDPNLHMSKNITEFGLQHFVQAIPRRYSAELVDVVERMLTIDAVKRASLAELLQLPVFAHWRRALASDPFSGPFLDVTKNTALLESHDAVIRLILRDLKTCAKSDIFIMFNVINKFWIRKEFVSEILETIYSRLGDSGIKRSDIDCCTESAMHKQLRLQFFGHCNSCGLVDGEGCCVACLNRCHSNHDIFPYMRLGNCYCDCAHHQSVHLAPQQQQQQQQMYINYQQQYQQQQPMVSVSCCKFRLEREASAAVQAPQYIAGQRVSAVAQYPK